MTPRPRAFSGAVVAVGLGLLASGPRLAVASTFEEGTGKVRFDEGAIAWGLEDPGVVPAGLDVLFLDTRNQPLSNETIVAEAVGSDQAIEGGGALRLGGRFATLLIDLRALAPRLSGHRIEISFWQRPEGTTLYGTIGWAFGDVDAFWQGLDTSQMLSVGLVSFQPTGRATDDGWEEWSTGPIDYSFGAGLPPAYLLLEDLQQRPYYLGNPSTGVLEDLRAVVDALEIRDLGRDGSSGRACHGADEVATCGEGRVCAFGRCVDAAQVEGQVVLDPEARRDFLHGIVKAFDLYDGSRLTESRLGALRLTLAAAALERTPERFWRALRVAVQRLDDGHANAPTALNTNDLPSVGACLLLGEADLHPGGGHLPLVTWTSPDHPLGRRLRVGDAVVAIDGLPVSAWAERMRHALGYAGDPAAREVVETPHLLVQAWFAGSTLTTERCPGLDGHGRCRGGPVNDTVDLAALAEATLWRGEITPFLQSGGLVADPCDHRVESVPALDDPVAFESVGYTERNGVRYVTFNGFPLTSVYGGSGELEQAFYDTFADGPARAIIDIRLGYGGYSDQQSYTSAFLLSPGPSPSETEIPDLDLPYDAPLRQVFDACLDSGDSSLYCGGALRWSPDREPWAPVGAAAATRVALLITDDVSGDDFFARHLAARTGPLRIFGPAPTMGAYGWIIYLPEEIPGTGFGSVQVTDTVFLDETHSDPTDFRTGHGVPPDEVVFQRQSDLLRGVDTLMAAARAWVTQ